SGVFNIKSRKVAANQKRFLLGISSINTRLISEGSFLGNKGSWLVSARRGYFDLVLKLTEAIEDIPSPFYYDILSRIQYQISKKHNMLANVLHTKDRLVYEENNGGEINNRYGNTCGWLRLESNFNPRLFIETVISTGRVDYNRKVRGRYNRDQNLYYSVSDQRDFRFYGLKQDWNLELCDQYDLKWGLDMKKLNAPYDYLSEPQNSVQTRNNYRCDTTQVIIRPSGHKFGAYLSNRFRIISPLTMEIGCRYDYASYTNDKLFSPRFNLVYALGQQTFIRSGWGHFYQTQGIQELQAQDGEDTFFPAEFAEHRVIGFEHVFKRGIYIRLEGYCKKLSDLRPAYRNWQQLIDISPEMSSDRLKILLNGSTAKGIEIYLKKDSGGKLTWWASYALAYVRDNVVKIINRDKERQYNNKELPSVFDQRHTFYFDINYRPNSKWQFHLAWQYHTGCPFTKLVPEKLLGFWNEMGEFNSSRYPPYHRMDLRITRHFNIHGGSITAFLEIVNLYDFRNVACFDYTISYWLDSRLHGIVSKRPEYWFPFLPSIGISWSWGK
ncbi:MAG: TonB-dependent receptor, partial [bacterium]